MGMSKCRHCGELTSRADGFCCDSCKALEDVARSAGKAGRAGKFTHYLILGIISIVLVAALRYLPLDLSTTVSTGILIGWIVVGVIFLMVKNGQGIVHAAIYMGVTVGIAVALFNFVLGKIFG